MTFTPFPKTRTAWDQTCFHCILISGFLMLAVQSWARLALSGWTRQHIEELLWPYPIFLGALLVVCSLIAAFQRQRLLGFIAFVVGVLSTIIALLPILLHEGIRD